MTNDEIKMNSDRFVMLDLINTLKENHLANGSPIILIVDSSNKYSYMDIEEIRSRVGNSIRLDDKENNLFTITLNVDSDYVIPHPGE